MFKQSTADYLFGNPGDIASIAKEHGMNWDIGAVKER
jgi:hypothetical protein